MAELNRNVAALEMDYSELAVRVSRTLETAYARIVTDHDVDATVQAFAVLLAKTADAMEKAELASEAAKSVRIALIRVMVAIGMSMEDIGAVHGLTRQRIGQLLRSEPELAPITRPPMRKRPVGKKRVSEK